MVAQSLLGEDLGGALEEAVELLDVGFIQIELGHCPGDLRVGEHAELLAAVDEALDLFEFLQIRY